MVLREALVYLIRNVDGAACVIFPNKRVSTVPNSSSPRFARSREPSTWSRIHFTLVPEVRVDDQTGIVADVIFKTVARLKLFKYRRYDGTARQWRYIGFAGFTTFPDDRGFTLVGDTDSGNLIRRYRP